MPQYDFPWEREAINAAKNGAPMPEGLDLSDQLAFQALAHLYGRYYLKMIDREAASPEKKQIIGAWEKRKSLDAFERKLTAHQAKANLATERCKREFLKAQSVEEAIQTAKTMIEKMDSIPLNLSPAVLEELKNGGETHD